MNRPARRLAPIAAMIAAISPAGPARTAPLLSSTPGTASIVWPGPFERCRAEGIPLGLCLRGVFRVPSAPGAPHSIRPSGPLDCLLPEIDDHCEEWAALYDNSNGYGGFGPDQATAIAAGQRRVYTTGGSWDDSTQHYDIATVAQDQVTGTRAWVARHDGEAGLFDVAYAVAVDREERRVFSAGTCDGEDTIGEDLAVVAHDSATGVELWSSCWDSGVGDHDIAFSVAVDAAGERVYVAGELGGDLGVVAFDASSGDRLWASTYAGPAGSEDLALSVGVSPDGERVYATGPSYASGVGGDYATVAFRAAADPDDPDRPLGELLWATRYDGSSGGDDQSISLAVAPDGSAVLVTGYSLRGPGSLIAPPPVVAATISYHPETGTRRWLAEHATQTPTGQGQALGADVGIHAGRVFVTGFGNGQTAQDYAAFTAAYALTTGGELWAKRFQPAGSTYGIGTSLAITPDGGRVISAGPSFEGYFTYKGDIATVAYDAATGTQAWAAKYTRPGDDVADLLPYPAFAAAAPDGQRVFTAGTYVNYYPDPETGINANFSDYWTLGYVV